MNNKCFVIKYPSTVDNDNLPIFGGIKVILGDENPSAKAKARLVIRADVADDTILATLSSGSFTKAQTGENIGAKSTLSEATNGLTFTTDSGSVLQLYEKYKLTRLDINGYHADFDISELKYSVNLTTLSLVNTNVTGDIAVLGNMVNLTTLLLNNTNVTGDIAKLAEQMAKGKVEHTLRVCTNSIMTNNGVKYNQDTDVIISFATDGTYTIQ